MFNAECRRINIKQPKRTSNQMDSGLGCTQNQPIMLNNSLCEDDLSPALKLSLFRAEPHTTEKSQLLKSMIAQYCEIKLS